MEEGKLMNGNGDANDIKLNAGVRIWIWFEITRYELARFVKTK